MSGDIIQCPEILYNLRRYYTMSGIIIQCPEILQNVRRYYTISADISHCPEILYNPRRYYTFSGDIIQSPEILYNVRKSFKINAMIIAVRYCPFVVNILLFHINCTCFYIYIDTTDSVDNIYVVEYWSGIHHPLCLYRHSAGSLVLRCNCTLSGDKVML